MATNRKMLGVSLLAFLFAAAAFSDEAPPRDKNSEAVNKALAALAKAYNAHDAMAIAELFTPQGEFIDADANVFDTHEAIAGEFAALFEVNPQKNSVEMVAEEIREISSGILSVDCVAIFPMSRQTTKRRTSTASIFQPSSCGSRMGVGCWLAFVARARGICEIPMHT